MAQTILKHLEAIISTGSIAAASRKLFVSQPSLSQYVKRVEADYEITIFDRSTTPWTLTAEGEALIEAQREIERIDARCRRFFADRRGLKTGTVIIGSTQYRTATLLNPVLSVFKRRYPGIMVRIEERATAELSDLVESGGVDCAFIITSLVTGALAHRVVYQEDVLVGLPPDHPYARLHPAALDKPPAIDLKALEGTPFVIMKRGQIFHEYFERLCARHRINLPVALETQSILTVPSLIEAGIGAALIPSTIAEDCRRRGVALYALDGELPVNELSLVWKKWGYIPHAVQGFIDTACQALEPALQDRRNLPV